MTDKEELKQAYKKGEWDMFCLITSVWYGKECYFRELSGAVYSRVSNTYFPSADDAYDEFLRRIGDD